MRDEVRERALQVVRDGIMEADWAGALEPGIEPDLRDGLLRIAGLLQGADFDGVVERSAPNLEVIQPPAIPDARTYRGREAAVEAFADWPAQWEQPRIDPVRIWQAGTGVVIAENHQTLRGRGSGVELSVDFWFVFAFRDGLLRRWTIHLTQTDAERAAAAAAET